MQFSWIRYSVAQNDWITIKEDDTGFEIVTSSNESSLKVIDASEYHEGTYICVIEDSKGNVLYSTPVQFSLSHSNYGNSDDPSSPINSYPPSDNNGTP